MIVETLAVGTELLLGQIVNSNAAEIGRRLAEAGLLHFRQSVVGDNMERVVEALRHGLERSDAIIVTGGIGPTQDDITREAICEATGVELSFSEEYAETLRERWAARGREMPESNLRQAQYPEGAVMIANPKGTAPGLRVPVGEKWVFALPGVPQEMLPMLDEQVIPFLVERAGVDSGVLVSRVIRSYGESESRVAELLDDLFVAAENPTVAFLASSGEIKVRLTARAADTAAGDRLLDPLEEEIRRRLGSRVFAVGTESIEAIVLRLVEERSWSLGTAESVTGGMVAARLTSVPGASRVFRGSIVPYGRAAKRELLGVPEELVAERGEVSVETASAMAEGAAAALGADVVVATTGSAGPAPLEHPPGAVVVAVRTPERTAARLLRMPGDRERTRTFTTTAALHMLRLAVTGAWWRT